MAIKGSRCLLAQLADPRLNGVLLGLDFDTAGPRVRDADFPCCGGQGERFDAGLNVVAHCGLPARLRRVEKLWARYGQVWGHQSQVMPTALPMSEAADVLHRLAERSARGVIFTTPDSMLRPGVLWATALAATWRFGLDCHVVTLGKTPIEGLLPQDGVPCNALFVERVDQLWDANTAFAFETLVAYAYHAAVPLWAEFVVRQAAPPATRRKPLSHKVSQLKARAPVEWLQPDCRSRLASLCVGIEKLGDMATV